MTPKKAESVLKEVRLGWVFRLGGFFTVSVDQVVVVPGLQLKLLDA
jgi:hypothetical protein